MTVNDFIQHDAAQPWPVEKRCLQTIVTSPPYWALRNYGMDGQIGMEKTPEEYVAKMVQVFRHAREALRNDGTLWLNLGDTYMGGKGANGASLAYQAKGGIKDRINSKALIHTNPGEMRPNDRNHPTLKAKQLVGIPWRVALALQADGWILRQDIIWSKPNCQPAPVFDRCVTSHEYLFLFVKQRKYYFDADALREKARWVKHVRDEPGLRNKRSVWTIPPAQLKEAHFASFPEEIPFNCIRAGSRPGDLVGDPFSGAGTVPLVARKLGRDFKALELKQEYIRMSETRLRESLGLFR